MDVIETENPEPTQEPVVPNIRFMYLTDCGFTPTRGGKFRSRGAVCLAYVINDGTIFYGAAFCSPKDRYEKASGRVIALARLSDIGLQAGGATVPLPDRLLRDVMRVSLMNLPDCPRWFRESKEAQAFCSYPRIYPVRESVTDNCESI